MNQRQRAGENLLHDLNAIVAAEHDAEELTWGQLLAAVADGETTTGRVVLVDAVALGRLQLTPRSRVELPSDSESAEPDSELFKLADLVVIAGDGVLAITSSASAAAFANQSSTVSDGVVLALDDGPLAGELARARGREHSLRFVTVDAWRAAPEGELALWPTAEDDQRGQPRGWNNYTFELSTADPQAVRFVHVPAMRAFAWALFLGLAGYGLWRVRQRPSEAIILATLGAFAAFVVPAAYLPLASALFLAGVLSLAVGMTRFTRPAPPQTDRSHGSSRKRSSAARAAIAGLLVAALASPVGGGSESRAGESTAAADMPTRAAGDQSTSKASAASTAAGAAERAAAPMPSPAAARHAGDALAAQRGNVQPVYRVIVPIDAKRLPLSDKLYVPAELYRELLRQSAEAAGRPKGWLIARGAYEGTLARDPVSARLAPTQLKATFDVQVLQAGSEVRLPFERAGVGGSVVAARLEGRAIQLRWNDKGNELLLGPLAADRYRLEIDFEPTVQTFVTTAGFDLSIPPLAGATLDLSVPGDASAIELPSVRGRTEWQRDRGRLVAQLGPADRLGVRWPLAGAAEGAAPNLEVDELVWVKIRPGTTMIDARFKYRVLAGRVGRIELLADPRLRLLPGPADDRVTAHTVPGDPQRIEFELARPVSDELVLNLSFLVTDASGVGRVGLPRLESSGARATKRWLAVSVDPALQFQVHSGEDTKPVDPAEFVAAWGPADSRPLGAYRIPRGEPMWGLDTQPSQPQTTVDQLVSLDLGRTSTRVQLDATLTISGGYIFQLGLSAPKELAVEQISVLEDGVQRVARWSSDAQGHLTVFLSAPLNQKQTLVLRGRIANNATGSLTVPSFQFAEAATRKCELDVYRQPAMLATVAESPTLRPIERTERRASGGFGALVGCYTVEAAVDAPRIALAPNVPRSHVVAVTYLQRDADRWMAELEYHADVVEGLADTLAFDIPVQWSEPFSLDIPMPFRIVDVGGQSRRQLVLYPEKPISGKFQLKIRGRVALAVGDRLRVPEIVPLGAEQLERFVVLPQRLDLQQVTWDMLGLARAALPAEFVSHPGNSESNAVYQVSAAHFQAALKNVARVKSAIRARLADVRVAWQADGNCQGVAAFDVEPEGAASCVLELPEGYRLLHATVDCLPALLVPLEQRRWRLPLGPRQLPARVELVFAGTVAASGGVKRFEAPGLSTSTSTRRSGRSAARRLSGCVAMPRCAWPALTSRISIGCAALPASCGCRPKWLVNIWPTRSPAGISLGSSATSRGARRSMQTWSSAPHQPVGRGDRGSQP